MKHMKKILTMAICIVTGLAPVLTGCGNSGSGGDIGGGSSSDPGGSSAASDIDPNQKWDLTLSEQISETEEFAKYQAEAFENITDRTNGQVTITGYYNNTLLEGSNQYSGISQGMADMCNYHVDANTGAQTLTPIFSLPSIGTKPTADKLTEVYQSFFDSHSELQAENEKNNVHVITLCSDPPSILHGAGKVMKLPEDMKGLKLISGARYSPMIGAYGASLQMPPSEYYSSVEKGVAQGQFTSFFAANLFGTLELLKTHTYAGSTDSSGFGNTGFGFIMNLDTWNSLPEEYQNIIKEELVEACRRSVEHDMADVEKYTQFAKDRGDTFVYLEDEATLDAWRAVAQLSADAWLDQCADAGYDKAACQSLYEELQKAIAAAN
jgi:TRAP-type C4-dicarboxylate transport system substrate-binding protein